MVILNNGSLRVEIAKLGAEIRRVTLNGKERFWNGNEKYWSGVAPVLFPICGALKDNKFTLDGKEYNIKKHGFAKFSEFKVEKLSEKSVVFLLTESEETLKAYPWNFEFRIKYTLKKNAIKIDYNIKNTSKNDMYAAVGAHEAYACFDGIENYDIVFEKEETINSHLLAQNGISRSKTAILKKGKVLPIYKEYFDVDALIFTDLKSRFATLRNRKTGEETSVSFKGFDNLLIWTKQGGAPYICIEPWAGFPSFEDEGYDITKKEGMTKIKPSRCMKRTHTIYL